MRRLAPATLRGRLALLALATTAIWVLTVVFNLALHAQLRRQSDDLLRTRAAAVAATQQTWPDGHIRVLEPSDDRALDVGVWIYQGYTAIERPRAPKALQASADRPGGFRLELEQDVGELFWFGQERAVAGCHFPDVGGVVGREFVCLVDE